MRATIALAALFAITSPALAQLKVGDIAPDFSLEGSDGKTHKLSELKGRFVVLSWFPKAETGG